MIEVGALLASERSSWQRLFVAYHAFYGQVLPEEAYARAWRNFQGGSRVRALGARLDGELVGIAHFLVHAHTTADDVCYVQDLFTAPDSRRQGVARRLIEEVTRWAESRDCSRVYWVTRRTNRVARSLYDEVGTHRGFIVYDVPLPQDTLDAGGRARRQPGRMGS